MFIESSESLTIAKLLKFDLKFLILVQVAYLIILCLQFCNFPLKQDCYT